MLNTFSTCGCGCHEEAPLLPKTLTNMSCIFLLFKEVFIRKKKLFESVGISFSTFILVAYNLVLTDTQTAFSFSIVSVFICNF